MARPRIDLYRLLPEHHRLQDAAQGHPLRALLDLVAEQADVVRRDVEGLYDDLFVETCAEWVVPYVGELVGNQPLPEGLSRRRADVAKTLRYRRRKGTLPMLEEMTRDVTGWGARAVATFELLGWTQALDHERREDAPNPTRASVMPTATVNLRHPGASARVGTAHVRDADAMDRVHGPWDETAHSADVRPPSTQEGWHNVPHLALFLWRLRSYPVRGATPRDVAAPGDPEGVRFTFSPLGNDAPLFNVGEEESSETERATELHVPGPIRPLALHLDLKEHAERTCHLPEADRPAETRVYYGESRREPGKPARVRRFVVRRRTAGGAWETIPAWRMRQMDLDAWPEPPAGRVGIDVRLGRLALHPDDKAKETDLRVDYAYGFADDMGGGPYDRSRCLAQPDKDEWFVVTKEPDAFADALGELPDAPAASVYTTLSAALSDWRNSGCPDRVIEVADSALYHEDVEFPTLGDEWTSWLVIQAMDGCRPNLRLGAGAGPRGDLEVIGKHPQAVLTLNGLLVEGGLHLTGSLRELNVEHCTLVPGRSIAGGGPEDPKGASIRASRNNVNLHVNVVSSIVGALRLPEAVDSLCVRDSVVHAAQGYAIAGNGNEPGPSLTVERSTILGRTRVREVAYASETIFTGPVRASRRQSGCVRFSHVPVGSRTPRRYRCQPDLSTEGVEDEAERLRIAAGLRPVFSSTRPGDPAYAQLSDLTPPAVRRGAEDGSEMGALCRLRQPVREDALRLRLEEYLPFGLQAGFVFIT